ncbi:MAG TPA: hypothetical protein VFX60_19270 [Micromonospora sp.]|nr:hypothetical protein [Micromonospora sp.]
MPKKLSKPQFRLIAAILRQGGTDAPADDVFTSGNVEGRFLTAATINACLRHGWVTREKRDGIAYWSVTLAGHSAAGRFNEGLYYDAKYQGLAGKATR